MDILIEPGANIISSSSMMRFTTRIVRLSTKGYVSHIYESVFNRTPEWSIDDGFELSNVEERAGYLGEIYRSDEAKLKFKDNMPELASAFVDALGYSASKSGLCDVFMSAYPTWSDFIGSIDEIVSAVASNTQNHQNRLEEYGGLNDDLDTHLTLVAAQEVASALTSACTNLQSSIKELIWHLSDTRGKVAEMNQSSAPMGSGADMKRLEALVASVLHQVRGLAK